MGVVWGGPVRKCHRTAQPRPPHPGLIAKILIGWFGLISCTHCSHVNRKWRQSRTGSDEATNFLCDFLLQDCCFSVAFKRDVIIDY